MTAERKEKIEITTSEQKIVLTADCVDPSERRAEKSHKNKMADSKKARLTQYVVVQTFSKGFESFVFEKYTFKNFFVQGYLIHVNLRFN